MDRSTRMVALGAALAAALALGIAFVSERWGGLVPCALCLLERWPYRVIVVLGLAASLLPLRPARMMLWLILLPLLAAIALGVTHVGVERGLWPSPLPECAAPRVPHGGSIADRMAAMPARPAKPCDEPTFLIPGLPVSMAAMNLVYALGFAIVLSISLLRGKRAAR